MPPLKKKSKPPKSVKADVIAKAKAKAKQPVAPEGSTAKTNVRKWGRPLIDAGWTCVPNTLIEHQITFGLSATDMNILLHLWARWWVKEQLPFPSVAEIGRAIGKKSRTVQRHLKYMEDSGYLKRVYRKNQTGDNDSNLYSFRGLISKATPLAEESLATRHSKKLLKKASVTGKTKASSSASKKP